MVKLPSDGTSAVTELVMSPELPRGAEVTGADGAVNSRQRSEAWIAFARVETRTRRTYPQLERE